MARKYYRDLNVYKAAKERIKLIFQNFERVCVAFSGGKDSTVLLHLALEVAQEIGFGTIDVLFVDLEGQYETTIQHVTEMFEREDIRAWWICLPINLRNASSMHEPFWCAWEPDREQDWIRSMPDHPSVISNHEYFPFYRYRMEFEEFIPAFNNWLSKDVPTAILVGIRADESLNRYLAVKYRARIKKCAWTPSGKDKPITWSARDRKQGGAVTFFPIYDWKFQDIWRYIFESGNSYNHLYDHMYLAGVPYSQMRICQPYGDDQRKGLDLFHRLEPETWFRVVSRVTGANYAARYCRQRLLGYRGGLGLPETFLTWQEYCEFLLLSLPTEIRQVYERRIRTFIKWWSQNNYPLSEWPDAGDPELERRKAQPSWRRVAVSLFKQDMARSLSFGFSRQDVENLIH